LLELGVAIGGGVELTDDAVQAQHLAIKLHPVRAAAEQVRGDLAGLASAGLRAGRTFDRGGRGRAVAVMSAFNGSRSDFGSLVGILPRLARKRGLLVLGHFKLSLLRLTGSNSFLQPPSGVFLLGLANEVRSSTNVIAGITLACMQ